MGNGNITRMTQYSGIGERSVGVRVSDCPGHARGGRRRKSGDGEVGERIFIVFNENITFDCI